MVFFKNKLFKIEKYNLIIVDYLMLIHISIYKYNHKIMIIFLKDQLYQNYKK